MSINKRVSGKYEVQFYNPLHKKTINVGNFDSEITATLEYNSHEFNFHKNNKGYLPKGIYIQRELFQVSIRNSVINKTIFVSTFKSLSDAKKCRIGIINSLIDI
jgi:hypothetical protein